MNEKEVFKNYKNIKIETNNLILRPLRKTDAISITKYLQEKEISKNTTIPYPYTLKDGEAFVKRSQTIDKNNFKLKFGVYNKKLKEIIGIVSLLKIDLKHKNAESGSWIGKPFWGTGLIYEAKIEMYKYGFENIKLRKITSKVYEFNPRSYKHLEKLGFVKQGVFRKHTLINNKFYDNYYYEMLKEEFKYSQLKKKLLKK
jgi:[ribosomal protein S5]-alanine N-acetyltransferase